MSFRIFTPLTALRKLCFIIYMCVCADCGAWHHLSWGAQPLPKSLLEEKQWKKESSQRVKEDRFFSQTTQTCSQCVYREASFVLGAGLHLICTKLQIKLLNIRVFPCTLTLVYSAQHKQTFKCILVRVISILFWVSFPLHGKRSLSNTCHSLGNHTTALQVQSSGNCSHFWLNGLDMKHLKGDLVQQTHAQQTATIHLGCDDDHHLRLLILVSFGF